MFAKSCSNKFESSPVHGDRRSSVTDTEVELLLTKGWIRKPKR